MITLGLCLNKRLMDFSNKRAFPVVVSLALFLFFLRGCPCSSCLVPVTDLSTTFFPSDINKPAIRSETLANTINDPLARNRTGILLSPTDYYSLSTFFEQILYNIDLIHQICQGIVFLPSLPLSINAALFECIITKSSLSLSKENPFVGSFFFLCNVITKGTKNFPKENKK